MTPLWVTLLLIILGCGMLLLHLHLARRPPRCPACRTPAEPLSAHHTEARIPVVELAYWCPRCAQVISRRFVTPVWDW
jgi:hypothetical protein